MSNGRIQRAVDPYPMSKWGRERLEGRMRGRMIYQALAEWAEERLTAGYLPQIRHQLQGPIIMVTGTYRDYPKIDPRTGKVVLDAEGQPVLVMRQSEKATWKDVRRFVRGVNDLAYGQRWQRRGVGVEAFLCVEPHERGSLHFHAAVSGLTTELHPDGVRYNEIRAIWRHGFMKVEMARKARDVIDYVAKHVIGYVATGKHGRSVWDYWGVRSRS